LCHPLILGHFLPWFTQEDSARFPLPPPRVRGLVLPEIEPWRHWRDRRSQYLRTHLHQPIWGEYDSRDPSLLRRQIATALDHGLDGFIVNLYGKNSVENILGLAFLDAVQAWNHDHPDRPCVYALSLDAQAQWPTEGKTPVSLGEDFAYLRGTWVGDACLRCDGRVPIFVFVYDRPCSEYLEAAHAVFGTEGVDLVWSSPRRFGQTSVYPWIQPDQHETDGKWLAIDSAGDGFLRRFYAEANENPDLRYVVGGVWPGFDDQLVSWAWNPNPSDPGIRPRVMCRETTRGNTLDLTWRVAADYLGRHRQGDPAARLPMPMIQVVTWNDWAEATEVEPSADFGFRALETCLHYARQLKQP
jgi:hypothetical protein